MIAPALSAILLAGAQTTSTAVATIAPSQLPDPAAVEPEDHREGPMTASSTLDRSLPRRGRIETSSGSRDREDERAVTAPRRATAADCSTSSGSVCFACNTAMDEGRSVIMRCVPTTGPALPAPCGTCTPAIPMSVSPADGEASEAPLARVEATDPVPMPKLPSQAEPSNEEQSDIVVTARRHTSEDPMVKLNVKAFAATEAVDRAVLGPVSLAYDRKMPAPVRDGIGNFLSNLREPVVFLNFLIQLKPGKAAETFGRFAINSTAGVAGLFDVAKRRPFKLPYRANSFADSMGYYGVKPGPYLFLPLMGPTTSRDLVGFVLDRLVLPLSIGKPFNRLLYTVPTGIANTLNRRAAFEEQMQKARASDDPYAVRRDYYLRMRQAEIDGLHGGGRGPVDRQPLSDQALPRPGVTQP